MKRVRELIDELKNFDPMLPVLVWNEREELIDASSVKTTSRREEPFGHFGVEDKGVVIT